MTKCKDNLEGWRIKMSDELFNNQFFDIDGNPLSLDEFIKFNFEKKRLYTLTQVGPYIISTIFSGININLLKERPPLIFEKWYFLKKVGRKWKWK